MGEGWVRAAQATKWDLVRILGEAKDAAGMYEVTHIHPLIEYYQGALFMDHGGYKRLRKRLLEYPPATEQVRGHGWVGGDGGGGPVPRGALFLDRWIYMRLKRRSIPTL